MKRGRLCLYALYLRILEFDDFAALRADHMVVARAACCLLVLSVTLREAVARYETAFVQQIKCLVHRSTRDLRAFGLQVNEEVIGVEMVIPGEYSIEHFKALRGNAVLAFLQVFPEAFCR